MAGSKNKEFQFQHCFTLLQHLPKWKLRDSEPKCKKEEGDHDDAHRQHGRGLAGVVEGDQDGHHGEEDARASSSCCK